MERVSMTVDEKALCEMLQEYVDLRLRTLGNVVAVKSVGMYPEVKFELSFEGVPEVKKP